MNTQSRPNAGETAPLELFKALAHESRLKLLGLAAQRPHSVQELARAAGLSEPTASHHLAVLRDAGLVKVRPDGTTHWYSFDAAALRAFGRSLARPETVAAFVTGAKVTDQDARIIKGYLTADGRLKSFPASRKKRRVFCAWFARMFDPARDYREAEVNEVIMRHHHDFETFRREMVGYKMMRRTPKGVYTIQPESEWIEN